MATKAPKRTKDDLKRAKQNALDLLKEDHQKVQKMFTAFSRLKEKGDPIDKENLVEETCLELLVHADLEEQVFYPAVRKAIHDPELMNEAKVEHGETRELIAQIQEMEAADELYNAKVTVLGEYVVHHIREEEDAMFPRILQSRLDLDELGDRMLARKEALLAEREAQ
ncbi:hemerythrin domain-containing protein [Mesoterricola sediminis]|uniref:Hemerythrin-like domain-containing protein n=1 Tax=Mesoterricola sediminis TaxID=2927980 RepID=A0AA48GVF4_9BACT|nr:hemerythrin domain-containing protein [Mesoterricola sediminis]BDU76994.1 hypothetical protein METESE_19520 [Mesoterricola sediminis]